MLCMGPAVALAGAKATRQVQPSLTVCIYCASCRAHSARCDTIRHACIRCMQQIAHLKLKLRESDRLPRQADKGQSGSGGNQKDGFEQRGDMHVVCKTAYALAVRKSARWPPVSKAEAGPHRHDDKHEATSLFYTFLGKQKQQAPFTTTRQDSKSENGDLRGRQAGRQAGLWSMHSSTDKHNMGKPEWTAGDLL